ncbi:hypothetical protein AXG93_3217s1260 [Marchantia polymorpha subsp. ruderalis]|uniref:Uncharacterized protein n=1 Tax=Marchantia polymorpha subsp. ruderalis TaxID=1480154 RepID=A0A176VWD2_MARPO|nr:hypothetical protein AXG93_3217s1260 [Marchantia polymorpha subsp. ruderalis]
MVGNAHHLLRLTTQPRYGGATQELKTVSDANSWKDVDKPVATKSARVNHQQELSLCAMNVRSDDTEIAQAGAVQPTTLESTALKTGLQDCVKSQSHRVRREQNGCQRLKPEGALIRNTAARYHQVSLAVESDNLYMGQSSSKLAEGAVSSDDDEIVAHRYTCKEFARRVLRGSIAYACLTLR